MLGYTRIRAVHGDRLSCTHGRVVSNCINRTVEFQARVVEVQVSFDVVAFLLRAQAEVSCMRYIVAWALGVPFSIVVLWYIVAHAGC